MDGEETVKAAMISTEIRTEWKTFRQLLVKQQQDTTASQLKELVSNDMLKAMFPNLNKIASIGLTIPVSTASVERSFSQMKMIKTRLCNSSSDCSLSHLTRFAIGIIYILIIIIIDLAGATLALAPPSGQAIAGVAVGWSQPLAVN